MLSTVPFCNLHSINNIVTDVDTLFVIPTFQRPYAWGQKQIKDLQSDLANAAVYTNAPMHYFAQVHVVPVDWNSPNCPIIPFIDFNNSDIGQASHHQCNRMNYAVVDGQQRLVTLYLLSILQAVLSPPALPKAFPSSFQYPLLVSCPVNN